MVVSHVSSSRASLSLPITSPSLLEECHRQAQSATNLTTSSPSTIGSPKARSGMARTVSLGAFEGRKRRDRFANMSKHGVPTRISSSSPGGQRYMESAKLRALSETINLELTPLCRQLVHPRKCPAVKSGNLVEDIFPMVGVSANL